MTENLPVPAYFIVTFFISRLKSSMGKSKPWTSFHLQPNKLRLRDDPEALNSASTDYGNMVKETPAAVLNPSSINDVVQLISYAYNNPIPFQIAARGQGHSVRGQAMARDGVVIDMSSLRRNRATPGITVSTGEFYADVGGEQRWIDVLNATLEYGLTPVSWTDYLYITVGGTLSNAGISGQTFRYGPQVSNVVEMDVVTGKGNMVTCSAKRDSELFHAVLGGLGQFGIIARARIVLERAPTRVKWVRMLYSNFSEFAKDQENLISLHGRKQENALDYLEGLVLLHHGSPDNWRSSFFPPSDHPRIIALANQNSLIYCLEVVKYYDDSTQSIVDKEVDALLEGLGYERGFKFEKDVSYVEFLNRVRSGELKLQSQGLWDVPHPWLNLFIPKSRISDFDSGVFKDIVLRHNITKGPVLIYPMNRSKWDSRNSTVIPDEEVFYTIGFLHSSGFGDWKSFDEQNEEILEFCAKSGIEIKQYLPHHNTKQQWIHHFGSKWTTFQERKMKFDPKHILSPGHKIFNA
ncbi:cytokinin dehydrogenase 3-like [Momordica charantia]|uniref:cytokinin dehydrogenase n=1 Tax=Momordica charantia TaxID=3673 RepID=A0A6J1DPL8_MOMCH|nr:cytokinin dehydrogenase 3-like [Momordica charantia]